MGASLTHAPAGLVASAIVYVIFEACMGRLNTAPNRSGLPAYHAQLLDLFVGHWPLGAGRASDRRRAATWVPGGSRARRQKRRRARRWSGGGRLLACLPPPGASSQTSSLRTTRGDWWLRRDRSRSSSSRLGARPSPTRSPLRGFRAARLPATSWRGLPPAVVAFDVSPTLAVASGRRRYGRYYPVAVLGARLPRFARGTQGSTMQAPFSAARPRGETTSSSVSSQRSAGPEAVAAGYKPAAD